LATWRDGGRRGKEGDCCAARLLLTVGPCPKKEGLLLFSRREEWSFLHEEKRVPWREVFENELSSFGKRKAVTLRGDDLLYDAKARGEKREGGEREGFMPLRASKKPEGEYPQFEGGNSRSRR